MWKYHELEHCFDSLYIYIYPLRSCGISRLFEQKACALKPKTSLPLCAICFCYIYISGPKNVPTILVYFQPSPKITTKSQAVALYMYICLVQPVTGYIFILLYYTNILFSITNKTMFKPLQIRMMTVKPAPETKSQVKPSAQTFYCAGCVNFMCWNNTRHLCSDGWIYTMRHDADLTIIFFLLIRYVRKLKWINIRNNINYLKYKIWIFIKAILKIIATLFVYVTLFGVCC